MSKLNEYGWAVKPSMPGHWHGTTSTGEFEIIITAAGIEARAEADSNQEAQRERAAAVCSASKPSAVPSHNCRILLVDE